MVLQGTLARPARTDYDATYTLSTFEKSMVGLVERVRAFHLAASSWDSDTNLEWKSQSSRIGILNPSCMYIPSSFAEEDLRTLHAFLEAHPLAALVTAADGPSSLFATHPPLLLDRSRVDFKLGSSELFFY